MAAYSSNNWHCPCGTATCICYRTATATTTQAQTIHIANTVASNVELRERRAADRRPRAPYPRVDPWVPPRLVAAAAPAAWPVVLRRFRGNT